MFKLFKKTTPLLPDYSSLGIDIHSHLLPGIDDGAKTIEDSLTLIKQLKSMGFRQLITTPHIMADLYPNTPVIIKEKLEEVRAAITKEGIDIKIDAAAEYLMDEGFEEKITQGDLLTLPGNRVLVEMSFLSPPPRLEHYLFKLQTQGYRPLLAHPERYLFYRKDFSQYEKLKDRGCAFQVNLLSLTGYYGKPVKDIAMRLMKEKRIDFIGTDTHHEQHTRLIQEALSNKRVNQLLQNYTFRNAELLVK
jgi:protein-tyrosine phosphatase